MTQESRVLAMLREKPCTTHDFCSAPGLAAEFRRAVSMLRKHGYQIAANQLRKGCWEYRLVVDPDAPKLGQGELFHAGLMRSGV